MKTRFLVILVFLCLLCSGCFSFRNPTSSATLSAIQPTPGPAGELTKVLPLLAIVFVGGLAFWGLTRSKSGWVIPASSAAGIVLVITITQYARLITISVIVTSIALLIWKAWQYQKERNEWIQTSPPAVPSPPSA